ncbi:hypothetical protein ABW21_db0202511 [Orbilia brochopaga]|nr:hypothetical protein ABW21_db0202511 [Drechslerella brochopaga]
MVTSGATFSTSISSPLLPHLSDGTTAIAPGMIFTRIFFFFHHIRAKYKRQLIQTLAEELQLKGVCKIGYPAFLYIEGENSAVEAYVKGIKRHRWKAMELRRKEQQTIDDSAAALEKAMRLARPFGVTEVDTSKAMSEILRTARLEEFLHKAFKDDGS